MRRTAEDVHEQSERGDEGGEVTVAETVAATADGGAAPGSRRSPGGRAHASAPDVEVVEPPIPERVRRPADGVRLAVAVVLLVLGLVVADLAAGTRGAVEQDLTDATSGLPRLLLTLLGWMSGIGVLLLPIGVGADLLVRRRPMQLIQALGAAVVGGILVIVLAVLVQSGNGGFVTDVLTRPTATGHTGPLDIVIVSMLALLTVADISGRKWISPIATVVVIATLVTTLLSGALTLAALACSLLVGWIVGLAFRLASASRPPGRPGTEVAAVLVAGGVPLTRLELIDANDAGDRRYVGATHDGTARRPRHRPRHVRARLRSAPAARAPPAQRLHPAARPDAALRDRAPHPDGARPARRRHPRPPAGRRLGGRAVLGRHRLRRAAGHAAQ